MSRIEINGVTPKNALGFMQRLSPTVTYLEASASSIASAGCDAAQPGPELILLSTWMGARESHIAKYVHKYRDIFPTSRILVAQCPFTHVCMPFLAWTQIRPAVPILKEVVQSEPKELTEDDSSSIASADKALPRVLIHAFSNGGISTTLFLYDALKRTLGSLVLPHHVFIFDSCPGTFKWRNTARALMQVLPHWTSPAIHAILFSIWLFYRVVPVVQPRQNVNSRTIRNPRLQIFEVRRTYLYGTEDLMIPPADIEHEAGLAAQAGFHVRLEPFEGATHVAIPMLHPDRYWRVIRETWYGKLPSGLNDIVVEEGDAGEARLKTCNGPEAAIEKASLVVNEASIQEEAGALEGDISAANGVIEAATATTGEITENVQFFVEKVVVKASDIKETSKEVVEVTQRKTEEIKAEASRAIEQGEAKDSHALDHMEDLAHEIEDKAAESSLSKGEDSISEQLEEPAYAGIEGTANTIKEIGTHVNVPVKTVDNSTHNPQDSARKPRPNQVKSTSLETESAGAAKTETDQHDTFAPATSHMVTEAKMKEGLKAKQHKAEGNEETSKLEQPQPPSEEENVANSEIKVEATATKPKSGILKSKKFKKSKRGEFN
ncbi:hypothetical protein NQ176_g6528 [Zarea fungicola]|uniref:Uncharacterized protein n=1 Tax=Zarea fungicola TaxID=93591 RepID=A0ACC1N3U1_9HYPO|nr:hypothetical protein NQ176_g6528 [Lecanicillium fungicola]